MIYELYMRVGIGSGYSSGSIWLAAIIKQVNEARAGEIDLASPLEVILVFQGIAEVTYGARTWPERPANSLPDVSVMFTSASDFVPRCLQT